MKKQILLCLFASTIYISQAQDLHFSNYEQFYSYFNPATTGEDVEDLKVGVQYRSQWAQIPTAYRTMGLQIEKKLKRLALGGILHQNRAGNSSLQTTGGLLNTTYYQPIGTDGNYLALGVGLGFLQKRFDPTALSFDNQFQAGVGFDATLGNGELFDNTNSTHLNFIIGTTINNTIPLNKPLQTQIGIAFANSQNRTTSFADFTSVPSAKLVIHGKASYPLTKSTSISPHFLFQKQGIHQEILIGNKVRYTIKEATQITGGLSYRWQDALILITGINWNNQAIHLSYDMSTPSKYQTMNNLKSFELAYSININGQKKSPNRKLNKYKKRNNSRGFDPANYSDDTKDTDQDGIPDQEDNCPNIAGKTDNQGCPNTEKDTDKDGVPDKEDTCRYLPGLKAFNGCPDSDKDGIPDLSDDCPYLQGSADTNGCPKVSEEAPKTQNLLIEFSTNNATISSKGIRQLNQWTEQLTGLGDYKILIAGHTDAEGDAAYNYALGQKRAAAIQQWLQQYGSVTQEIETISYGEIQPKEDNESMIGKAKNRRVEVIVVLY